MRYLAILIVVLCSTAQAEQSETPGFGVLLPAISFTTDHRFNGMSLSDRGPAVQASLHLWRADGYYGGLWISQVDFRDGETGWEYDSYVGRNLRYGKNTLQLEAMYIAFDDDRIPGPSYDFLQLKSALERRFAILTLKAAALYTPSGSSGSGRATQFRMESERRLFEHASISATAGRLWSEHGQDRSYWDVGITFEWRNWDMDLRYYDTNVGPKRCFGTDWCEAGLAAKLTLASY